MTDSAGYTRPDDPPTTYRDPSTGSTAGATGTAGAAKEQGAHVAGVAKEQAAGVAQEAGRQAKNILAQSRGEVGNQLTQQKHRAATGIAGLADQIGSLGGDQQSGVVGTITRQASERVNGLAVWLDEKEPAELLQDVQSFARRRPGAFLATAGVLGLVAGRLTRSTTANAHDASDSETRDSAGARTSGDSYPSTVHDPYAGADARTAATGTPGTTTTGTTTTGTTTTGTTGEAYPASTTTAYPTTVSGTQGTTGETYR